MTTPTGVLFYDPRAKPLSVTGQFQAGCYLYFYLTGTTDQADVYADGELSTPLAQPVTSASDGRFVPIYLDPSVIYRVQLYSYTNVILEDTDPYVPLPIPSSVTTLIGDITSIQSQLATLQATVTGLQTTANWSALVGIPAPIAALAASTPPDTGLTFWRDDGTWATPNLTGVSVTQSLASDSGSIGTTFVSVLSAIPVTAGASYSMYFEGNLVVTGSGALSTLILANSGTPVGLGPATSTTSQASYSGTGEIQAMSNTTDYGNAAYPGLDAESVWPNATNCLLLRGRFTAPAGSSAVALQFKISSGSAVAKAGGFITLTQIAAA